MNPGDVNMNMKLTLRKVLVRIIDSLADTFVGKYFYPLFAYAVMRRVTLVQGTSGLKFFVPNSVNRYRAETFLTKEPETLEWLDRIPAGSVVWDIGANVGLYTCYAAKVRKCRVFAFEPSVLNLELLARNIYANDLCELVTIVPLPLSDKLSFNTLNMSSIEWGGAKSTFKENYGHDGRHMTPLLKVPTIGLSMVEMVGLLKIRQPDYIKMDVDGIEHLILGSGGTVLRSTKEVLVEINDDFQEQADLARRHLLKAGFQMVEKRHAVEFDESETAIATTFNQIWVKAEHA
jgi:FkbM family methyltransferase